MGKRASGAVIFGASFVSFSITLAAKSSRNCRPTLLRTSYLSSNLQRPKLLSWSCPKSTELETVILQKNAELTKSFLLKMFFAELQSKKTIHRQFLDNPYRHSSPQDFGTFCILAKVWWAKFFAWLNCTRLEPYLLFINIAAVPGDFQPKAIARPV